MAKFQSKTAGKKKGVGTEIRQALMTGVSYMLPLVIAGAVIMGVSRIGASFFGVVDIWDASYATSDNGWLHLLHQLDVIGGQGPGRAWRRCHRQCNRPPPAASEYRHARSPGNDKAPVPRSAAVST